MAVVGHLDRAARIATSIRRRHARSEACSLVVQIAAATGDLEPSTLLLRLISHPFWRSRAIIGIALALFDAGDHAAASDPMSGNGIWFLIRAALRVGDFDRAESLVRSIEDLIDRSTGVEELVNALIVAGEVDKATSVARSTPLDFSRATALAAVAAATLAGGAAPTVDGLVAELFPPRDQARYWRAVAKYAPVTQASQFVAPALQTGPWHDCLLGHPLGVRVRLYTVRVARRSVRPPTEGSDLGHGLRRPRWRVHATAELGVHIRSAEDHRQAVETSHERTRTPDELVGANCEASTGESREESAQGGRGFPAAQFGA
ncbi:hypothetical protein SAMN05216188_13346 [Lentzea xinjiangensis]|uniref:Uncharacterized protein n=1 Tax=Lentzea xinjiangensis TaxID=402600 RepID=A0A1H9WG33_9PSEU|nr:hypothetical protein SAMN05216188_13346 [Lentzea xinjiangensis]